MAALGGRFDYYCWDLYARVGDFYAADPARKKLQAETLHAIEAAATKRRGLAEHVAARIVDCHLATMERLGIRYELLAHESDILRLHFWDRAFELLKQAGAIRLESEGKNAGCWVLSMEEGEEDDKIIVRSNGTVTYTGKDIAYQLWKLGQARPRLPLSAPPHLRRRPRALDHAPAATGEPGAPAFGHADAVYNVIDVGQSYPQRVVKAGVAALGHAEGAAASHHLAYEKVVLSPATARALGYDVTAEETSVKVSGRKGLGVKADDLIDALVAKARHEIVTRDPERTADAPRRRPRAIATGALRYFLLKFGRTKIITFDMEEALAFTGETGPYIQNGVVRARSISAEAGGRRDTRARRCGAARRSARPGRRCSRATRATRCGRCCVLMARSEEIVEQTVQSQEVALLAKHVFTVAQAFHSYYQNAKYSVLRAESDERRAFRALVVDLFLRQMAELTDAARHPGPGARCEASADRHHDRLQPGRPRDLPAPRRLRPLGRDRRGACRSCWPRAARGTRLRSSTGWTGWC